MSQDFDQRQQPRQDQGGGGRRRRRRGRGGGGGDGRGPGPRRPELEVDGLERDEREHDERASQAAAMVQRGHGAEDHGDRLEGDPRYDLDPSLEPGDGREGGFEGEDERERYADSDGPAEVVERVEGCLVVVKDGFGFLRQARHSYLSGAGDVFVPQGLIQRYRLRSGHFLEGRMGRGRRGKRKRPLEAVDRVDGQPPELVARRPNFKSLVAVDPNRRIYLETHGNDATLRVIDLVAPLGFGQRMLVVAPPRTGKTVVLQKIANAIGENHPDAHVLVLLVDERPEEVTDFRRSCPHAEVVASSLDMDTAAHVAVTEVVLERVRRLAEQGRDVVCLIDSLTRMSRAFNTERGRSGRTLTGGMDSSAMQKPREFFGCARAFEGGGSITNVATVLVDTGSKMDQVIYEEFKGTGNAELVLDRDLADLRIFPAINVKDSGTRKEEKLRDPKELQLINVLRRGLLRFPPQRVMEALIQKVKATSNNAELLLMLNKQAM